MKRPENPLEYQVGGNHYSRFEYQPIQLIHDLNLDFDTANVIKYLARYDAKGGIEDLEKALQYLHFKSQRGVDNIPKIERFVKQFDDVTGANLRMVLIGEDDLAWIGLSEMIKREKGKKVERVKKKHDDLPDDLDDDF